jgi:NAD kinase
MNRLTENKLVLVTRQTRLEELVVRFNTVAQAKFYVEHLGADFSDYEREHARYRRAVADSEAALSALGRLQTLRREFLPNFIFGPEDTIVVLGQDGLVANTVKYSDSRPIIGVNPDPARWDGVLLPFTVADLPKIVPEVFAGRRQLKEVTMAKAELGDGQKLFAVNDLFVGVRSHVSARYTISAHGREERQSSSGIVVSTGLGSTGWFKSLMTGAVSIARAAGGEDVRHAAPAGFAWDADWLYFTVREPFPSKSSGATLVFGRVTRDEPLVVVSQTPEAGVIFSDGVEKDFLEFNSGARATITLAEKKGLLAV